MRLHLFIMRPDEACLGSRLRGNDARRVRGTMVPTSDYASADAMAARKSCGETGLARTAFNFGLKVSAF
jgi:hypothetical protein